MRLTISPLLRISRNSFAAGAVAAALFTGCISPGVFVHSHRPGEGSDDYAREYQRAYELYTKGKFHEALPIFLTLRERDSRHPLADNAQYHIGECYLDLGDSRRGTAALEKVLLDFSHSNKCEAALFKLGVHHLRAGNRQKASCYFIQLREEHPDSPHRKDAESYLKQCGMSKCS